MKQRQVLQDESAFSLLEVLVTLSLIAFISAILIPNTTSILRTTLDSYARKMANVFREARDYALLTNKVVRIEFDLDKQEYWVEDTPGSYLFPAKTEDDKNDSKEEKDAKNKKTSAFRMTREISKKKMTVPNGIRIASIVAPRSPKLIQEGLAEVYYFPHGTAEAAVLHLEDADGNKRSLIVHPITGKTRLVPDFYFPSEDHK